MFYEAQNVHASGLAHFQAHYYLCISANNKCPGLSSVPRNLNPLHGVVTLAWVIIKFLHGLITLVAKLQLLNFECLFFYSIAERHRNKISEVTFETLFRVDQLKVFYSSYSKKSFDFCVLTSCASISICLSLLQKDTFMRIYPRLREVALWLGPRPNKSGWLLRPKSSLLPLLSFWFGYYLYLSSGVFQISDDISGCVLGNDSQLLLEVNGMWRR